MCQVHHDISYLKYVIATHCQLSPNPSTHTSPPPHRSHATQAPQQLGSDILWPADVTYVGTGVQEAMAVSSALHGGQVAITQPVWGQLQGKVQANQQVGVRVGVGFLLTIR